MPQLLVFVAAGIGLFNAYKWLSREADKAVEAARQARDKATPTTTSVPPVKDLGALVWDEASGAYRPKG